MFIFEQFYKGIPVHNGMLRIKVNKNGCVSLFINGLKEIQDPIDVSTFAYNSEAVLTAVNILGLKKTPRFIEAVKCILEREDRQFQTAYKINVVSSLRDDEIEMFVDGKTLELIGDTKVVSCSVAGKGKVFAPSPTWSASTPYENGSDFSDNMDWTNPTLNNELVEVDLIDILSTNNNTVHKLEGPFATIIPNGSSYNLVTTSSTSEPSFDVNRWDPLHSAVMAYYYIDKSIRGVEAMGYDVHQGVALPIAPEVFNSFDARFTPSTGEITLGDGTFANFDNVDAAEDAFIITHEFGHALDYRLSGHLSNFEGASEGISDYWGLSETRPCDVSDTYNEYDAEYDKLFHWGLMPTIGNPATQRTLNIDEPYSPFLYPDDPHSMGQFLVKALMRIHSDIGKEKTDLMVLEALGLFGEYTDLQSAAKLLYLAALDMGFSDSDLCIVYGHLDDVFSISTDPDFPQPPTSSGDYYIRDTHCDKGIEPNPDQGPMWNSPDIWVRHENDGGLTHQNPEYKSNSPNWIYVRIHNKGCISVNDANLRLYYSKASTGLDWPVSWNDFFININGEQVLAGDEITEDPIQVSGNIKTGETQVIAIPWYPPNPEIFGSDEQHFCLLARIESSSDPISFSETIHTNVNTRNNNNIAWRNLSLFNNDPNNILGPITVFLSCEEIKKRRLEIQVPTNSLGRGVTDIGQIFIKLDNEIIEEWLFQDDKGEGFTLDENGVISVESEEFVLRNIPQGGCGKKVHVSFIPRYRCRKTSFDIIETDVKGNTVGGERFKYDPIVFEAKCNESPHVENLPSTESNKPIEGFELYPNPVVDELTIRSYNLDKNCRMIHIYDYTGTLVIATKLVGEEGKGGCVKVLDTSNLKSGIYIVKITYDLGRETDLNTVAKTFVKL